MGLHCIYVKNELYVWAPVIALLLRVLVLRLLLIHIVVWQVGFCIIAHLFKSFSLCLLTCQVPKYSISSSFYHCLSLCYCNFCTLLFLLVISHFMYQISISSPKPEVPLHCTFTLCYLRKRKSFCYQDNTWEFWQLMKTCDL